VLEVGRVVEVVRWSMICRCSTTRSRAQSCEGHRLPAYFTRISGYGAGLDSLPHVVREVVQNSQPLVDVLGAAQSTLTHADRYRGNVRRPSAAVRVLIDWEDAVRAPAAFDVAALMLEGPWFLGRSLDRDRFVRRYLLARNTDSERDFERELDGRRS
jgi:hypothetical protein